MILQILKDAKVASREIAGLPDERRTDLVRRIADALEGNTDKILFANEKDLARMESDNPKYDRLLLNKDRISSIANDVRNVADIIDPTNQVLLERVLENGIKLEKKTVPLGVVGVIYEARPNVTMDVAALCLKSGNAVVLRGGSDALNSNEAMVSVIQDVLEREGVSKNIVQLLPADRKYVAEFLAADKYIDVIIPRGSAGLIKLVRENSSIPTIETGAGVCHTFVESSAKLEQAAKIVINAKTQRPSVCNCLDTIIVQYDVAKEFLPLIIDGFLEKEVEIFADDRSYEILSKLNYPYLQRASVEDFGREFLSQKCSVRVVDTVVEALDHIAEYSSRHSEAICSEDAAVIEKFLNEVDAAAVYANASTRFTDGAVFGLGAEIGISTQKLHARGPFALEKLVTEKWVLRGCGQIR